LLHRVDLNPETLSVEVFIVRLGRPGIGPPAEGALVEPAKKSFLSGTSERKEKYNLKNLIIS